MRCQYREIACNIEGPFACFECEKCRKRVNVAAAIKDKINSVTRALPDCTYVEPAVVDSEPSLASANVTAAATEPPVQANNQPAAAPSPPSAAYNWDPAGAGTQLKKLLSKLGIKSTENCSCNTRAKIMNEKGIEWCEQNIGEIVGWLKEEATRRKLPFLSLPTKILVQRAIKIAKRIRDANVVDAIAVEPVEAESSSGAE